MFKALISATIVVVLASSGRAHAEPAVRDDVDTLLRLSLSNREEFIADPLRQFSSQTDVRQFPPLDPRDQYVVYKVNNDFGSPVPVDHVVSHSYLVAYNVRTGAVERAYSFINEAGMAPFGPGAWENVQKAQNIEGGKAAVEARIDRGRWTAKEIGRGHDLVRALDAEFVIREQSPGRFAPWRNCKVAANELMFAAADRVRIAELSLSDFPQRYRLPLESQMRYGMGQIHDHAIGELKGQAWDLTYDFLDRKADLYAEIQGWRGKLARGWQEFEFARPSLELARNGIGDLLRDMPSPGTDQWRNSADWQNSVLDFGLGLRGDWLRLNGLSQLGELYSTAGMAWKTSENLRRTMDTVANIQRSYDLLITPTSDFHYFDNSSHGGGLITANDRQRHWGSFVEWSFKDTSVWGTSTERPGVWLPVPGPIVQTEYQATSSFYRDRARAARGEFTNIAIRQNETHIERYNRFDLFSNGFEETRRQTSTRYTYRFNGAEEQRAIERALAHERSSRSASIDTPGPPDRNEFKPPDDRKPPPPGESGGGGGPPPPPPPPPPTKFASSSSGNTRIIPPSSPSMETRLSPVSPGRHGDLNTRTFDAWRAMGATPLGWRAVAPTRPTIPGRLGGIMLAPEVEIVIDRSGRTDEMAAKAVDAVNGKVGGSFTVDGQTYMAVRSYRSLNPIHAAGFFRMRQADLILPGDGHTLELARYYDSAGLTAPSMIAPGWSMTPFSLAIESKLAEQRGRRQFGDRIALLDHSQAEKIIYRASDRTAADDVMPPDQPPSYRVISGTASPLLEAETDGGYTVTFPHAIVARFDSRGRLEVLRYPDGDVVYGYQEDRIVQIAVGTRKITLAYNDQGRLELASGTDGQHVKYDFAADGSLIRVSGESMLDALYSYGKDARLSSVAQLGVSGPKQILALAFDEHGRMLKRQTYEHAWTYKYDDEIGRLVATTEGGESMVCYYDRDGRLVAYGPNSKDMTLLNYDTFGRVLQAGTGELLNEPSANDRPRFRVTKMLTPAMAAPSDNKKG